MNWKDEVVKFKSSMKPETSVISGRSITFGFFGSVGGGKSVTAGIFAVGITPKGLIGWVDGEGHRSGWAVDIVADLAATKYGGTKKDWIDRFKVIYIEAPFSPLKVIAAQEMLESAGCKTIILDVLSQAWDSEGGYLDLKDEQLNKMAGDDEAKKKRAAAAAAAAIKPWTHQKMVNAITSAKVNLVLLFQAKKKFNAQSSKPNDFESPIQESGLARTALAVGFVQPDESGCGGYCSFNLPFGQGTKTTHPSILAALPKNTEQFKFEHAEAILKLCGGVPNSAGKPAVPVKTATGATRTWMLDQLKDLHVKMQTYGIDKGIIMPNEGLEDWPLSKVPTDKILLAILRKEIEQHL